MFKLGRSSRALASAFAVSKVRVAPVIRALYRVLSVFGLYMRLIAIPHYIAETRQIAVLITVSTVFFACSFVFAQYIPEY